ncbi:DNA mismatch repair protein Msh3 [Trichonephila inaurata madagascariensis]|uniref:DNA mismatch repair protein MSH3 n=1 Tax=Trichonephila inaurata madagascariensis TaxID=2747483 RepID=A0A8X7CT47_9ARAC|nr:DNA mismatch repair protein Msh3 [Trichonephila inaurata madagascariensis]
MSNKRIKSSTKNSSKNQPAISKYFISISDYPSSSLKKRNAETDVLNDTSRKKTPKLEHESDSSKKYDISETLLKLQAFKLKNINRNKSCESSCGMDCENISQDINPKVPISQEQQETTTQELSKAEMNTSENFKLNDTADKNLKYTALEKQYLELRSKYPDALLLIECGYKYRFFGKDAETVSKICNIACFKNHNFMSAIIPTPRLHFYVRQLVSKGYKVGVIKQVESAALKAAGEKRNELFSRKLDALYTKSTLIGEEFFELDVNNLNYSTDLDANPGYLTCICESFPINDKQKVNIGIVGIQIYTGDFLYTSFEDSPLRNKLETYLLHINPVEILIPSNLSKETENFINIFSSDRSVRVEKIDETSVDPSSALNFVSEFYASKDEPSSEPNTQQMVLSLPTLVISCLSALIIYLTHFNLESIFKNLPNMKPFSTDENMILTATTIKGLEILRNNSNYSEYKSLFWVLNKTSTKFGERLLKLWVAKPLKNIDQIEERLNIITEVIHSESIVFKVLEKTLIKLPDLERILSCVFYHRCSPFDFLKLAQAFMKIKSELLSIRDKVSFEIHVPRTKILLTDLPELLSDVDRFLSNINIDAAREGNKTKVFQDISMYPAIQKCRFEISDSEKKLNDLRPKICKILKMINFKYTSVALQKYLIEVPNSNLHLVPNDWLKINSTKQVSRFKSPEILQLCNNLDQQKELMFKYSNDAWSTFLNEFGAHFYKYKRAISYLAELDCYLSLSKVAKEENYCRPLMMDASKTIFNVQQGRHPVNEKIMGEGNQFVANDVELNEQKRCMIVTGPNMGGKSTYVRQIALIAIMAHMGCYVPAETASVPLFDAIYVRMGSEDALEQGKSLVILDELGRGTSTNDGTAIAYSTLKYLINEIRCFTLFVTHYPSLVELKKLYPENISVVHMDYILKENIDDHDIETVTFLYNVVEGISKKSYGINVAALAGIPKDVLLEAQAISQKLELQAEIERKINMILMKISTRNG